jgi:cytochrome c-type biogenesis protein CcmH/NrfG
MSQKTHINLLFGTVILALGVVAAASMYINRDRPVIRESLVTEPQAETRLPGNHPPMDLSNRLMEFEEMSRKEPGNAEYRVQIGNVYYDMGQHRKAASAYEEALKMKPQDPNVETDLATCYYSLGEHDRALQILDAVLRYQPNFPMAMFNKGIVLQVGKNDSRGAIAVWEALLQANPDFPQRAALEQRIRESKVAAR